jgi:hypothetical protein
VLPFFHFLDDLADECIEIAWVARGDDAVVGDDFGIFPLAAGVDHVGLDRLVGGHLAARSVRFSGKAGLDQEPRRVAHRRDRLAGIVERLDELERIRIDAQQIGIDLAAGQHDGVVIGGRGAGERLVDLHRPAPVLLVPALDLALFGRHDIHRRARRFQLVARNFEFRLLEAVGGENEDALAVQLSWHAVSPFLWSRTENEPGRIAFRKNTGGVLPTVPRWGWAEHVRP